MIKRVVSFLKSASSKLSISIKRFPESMLLATLTVIVLIYMNHLNYGDAVTRESLSRIAMTLAIGIPIFLCIKVFFERKPDLSKGIKIITYITAIILLFLNYFYILNDLNQIAISRYIGFSISFYLMFSFIPYFFKNKNYEIYVITLFNRFVTTYLYSVVLFLGLAAIIGTIDLLFNVNIPSETYFDMFLIVAGIFAPAFFLADIPEFGFDISINEYSKVLRVLLLYIVLPLIVVYTTILYAYFIKILISMHWPEGVLGHLVLWYSIISTVVMFFIYPLRNKEKWVEVFIRFFPKLILPLLIMMFVSLGIRINAYGITENRYFVLLAGLWVSGCMLYHTLNKKPKNIIFTISLAIISIIGVVGPFSAYSISKFSQNMRFEDMLNSNNMISINGEIQAKSNVSKNDKEQISSIILYFENNHSVSDLKYIPNDFEMKDTEDVFGFELQTEYMSYPSNTYFSYNIDQNIGFINIKDYDYFADYTSYRGVDIENAQKPFSILYSEQDREIKILENDEIIYTKDIDNIVTEIHSKISADDGSVNKHTVSIDNMTYTDNTSNLEVLYVFNSISGVEEYNGETKIHPPMFYVFVKTDFN